MLYILSLFAYNEYILSFKEHPVKFLRTVPVQCTLYFTHILVKTGRPYIIVSWVHWGRPPWETINPGQNSSLTSPQALPGLYPPPPAATPDLSLHVCPVSIFTLSQQLHMYSHVQTFFPAYKSVLNFSFLAYFIYRRSYTIYFMWLLLQSNQTMHRWRDATPTAGPLFALAERFVRIHSPFGKTANQTCFPQFDRSVHSCQRYEKGMLVLTLLCSPQLVTVIFVKLMPMTHSSSSHSALPSPPSLSIDQTVSQGEGHWNPPNRRDFGLALIHNQSTSNIESSCLCWRNQLLSSRLTFHWLSQGILIKDKNCSVLEP